MALAFHPHAPVEEWLQAQDVAAWKQQWLRDGFVVVHQLVDDRNIAIYRDLCEQLLSGQIDASTHRHDLGAHVPRTRTSTQAEAAAGRPVENTTQIMWPSLFFPDNLAHGPLHQRSMAVSAILLAAEPAAAHKEGQVAFDFDMVIDKLPHSNTPVPWHQDEAYWRKANLNFDDVRAASCWCSLDHATIDNGCMWFVPGSHLQPVAEHVTVKEGAHAIEAPEVAKSPDIMARAVPVPLDPGSATFHAGRTLHHTRGNATAMRRRAWITNHRPEAMVAYERSVGFDHGKGGINSEQAVGFGGLGGAT